ncbi:MAG TPA: cytochrome c oxidase subunit II [Solirubrobacteraceae bacterium]|nr:cytochrome c oxidase subunit II [Solirubrobacteraceae bacterium]
MRPAPEMRRILIIWFVLSVIATPLVAIFVGPLLPPGAASDAAHGQQQDNTVMTALVTPIVIALLVYFVYSFISWRVPREADVGDGPPLRGSPSIMGTWVAVTVMIVIFLATWGSYELFPGETGAGGGQGPDPLAVATPAAAKTALRVQVIGQQWQWTFRYPSFGGVETTQLVLPVNRQVRFEVTSIDVVHSFWAIQLGVKADAVPDEANVAFVKPVKLGTFDIRCAELCGLWHGHMATHGQVVSMPAFQRWIAGQRRRWAPIQKYLPPMKRTYMPQPDYRAG